MKNAAPARIANNPRIRAISVRATVDGRGGGSGVSPGDRPFSGTGVATARARALLSAFIEPPSVADVP
jgi:hypothetical protein